MKNSVLIILFSVLNFVVSFAQNNAKLDFKLKNVLDDKEISLNSFAKEKGVIIVFVSNGCPVSEMYQSRIAALNAKFAPLGYPVVAIDPADKFEKMKEKASSKKYPYYFLHDETQQITKNYKVNTNTHTFVLQNTPSGFKIVFDGAIDDDLGGEAVGSKYVENAIADVLAKKPVQTKSTKVIGCPFTFRKVKNPVVKS
jgi:peroxiredoxin